MFLAVATSGTVLLFTFYCVLNIWVWNFDLTMNYTFSSCKFWHLKIHNTICYEAGVGQSFNVKTFNFIKKPLSGADSKNKVVKLCDHSFNLQSTFHHILICLVCGKDQHITNVKTFMHKKLKICWKPTF